MSSGSRETWATRLGFIVAAIGSAVGLGNIWQFPFKTGTNGGAAFLVFYLVAVVLIGMPAMLAEFTIGRRSKANVIDAFDRLGQRQWRFVGILAAFTGFWILSYYSVVGGWVGRYIVGSATGAYFGDPGTYFGTVSAGIPAVAAMLVFLAITVGIVALGVQRGIELATKVMVPSILVLMVGLAIWAVTLEGAGPAYEYFLLPELDSLLDNAATAIPFAVGQAFFTLSLGMGIMVTYSSYIGEDDDLGIDGGIIVVVNTLVGILAGLVVFPILFANGVDPNTSGPAALFVAVASAFGQVPFGEVVGVVFFGVVLIAALSSAISLLEVTVSWATDVYDVSRPVLAVGVGTALFVLGLPSAWDTAWLTWFDNLAYQLFLPMTVLYILILVATVFASETVDELRAGSGLGEWFPTTWLWLVRTVVIVGVVLTLGLGMQTLFLDGAAAPPL